MEWKWKVTIIFPFLEKILQKFYKNPTFVTFCDDVINVKTCTHYQEQLRQSFWQLVKAFRFKAKKIEGRGGGGGGAPPWGLKGEGGAFFEFV